MITFNTLDHVQNSIILDCFNLAFSDYCVPFHLSLEQLETKLFAESIDKSISIGAFDGDTLVGFVLHGNRSQHQLKLAYNGGTGVIPTHRGQALTQRMYDFILPILRIKDFDSVVLEVISNNIPAIKSYTKIGFHQVRSLHCFKGELNIKEINKDIKIVVEKKPNIEALKDIGEIKPTWQNSKVTILNLADSVEYMLAYNGNELCGYCIINSLSNRILQIAVEKRMRNKLIASTLLHYIQCHINKSISIINVDSAYPETIAFFGKKNLVFTLSQEEMELNLTER